MKLHKKIWRSVRDLMGFCSLRAVEHRSLVFFLPLCWDKLPLLEMQGPDRGTQSGAAHGATQPDFCLHFCFASWWVSPPKPSLRCFETYLGPASKAICHEMAPSSLMTVGTLITPSRPTSFSHGHDASAFALAQPGFANSRVIY